MRFARRKLIDTAEKRRRRINDDANDNNKVSQVCGSGRSCPSWSAGARFVSGDGHEYHLYVYDEVRRIPKASSSKTPGDTSASSSSSTASLNPTRASPISFATNSCSIGAAGGRTPIWCVCARSIFKRNTSSQASWGATERKVVNAGVLKSPPRASDGVRGETCQAKDTAALVWGETGPRLVAETVRNFRWRVGSLTGCFVP